MNSSCPASEDKSAPAEGGAASARAEKRMKTWTSQELFAGERELVIVHADSEYRLRLTSQGKLVLTK